MLSLAGPQSPFLFYSSSSGSVWGWPVVSSPPTGFISIRPPRTCGLSLPLIFPKSQSSGLVDFQALWGWANRVWWVCVLGPMVLLKRGMLVFHSLWCQTGSWIILLGVLSSRSAAEHRKPAAIGKFCFFFFSTVLLRCPFLYKTCQHLFPLLHLGSEGSGKNKCLTLPRTLRFREGSLSSVLSTEIKQCNHRRFPQLRWGRQGSCILAFSVDGVMASKPERFAWTACCLCLIQAQCW